jgi:hypothetical protein
MSKEDTLDIYETIRLSCGGHKSLEDGVCVMELSSYLAHEPWSDTPKCVSPVLGAFLRSWNDALDDETRQLLKPYAAKVLKTAGSPEADLKRAWMATDWLAREFAPAWLRAAGLKKHAEALENLVALVDDRTARVAQSKLSAAWDAAGDAARSAARSAAWNAARDAAWNAARSAARSAAWDAAGDAARSAARSAAWDAAWNAARDAAWNAARSAAWDAAGNALAPTVKILQASAFKLLDRMIAAQ